MELSQPESPLKQPEIQTRPKRQTATKKGDKFNLYEDDFFDADI